MKITRAGDTPSAPGPADYFTGTVRVDRLFQAEQPGRAGGAHVTFEPGARTAWHTHPAGQTLIVTFGRGRVQREGGPIEEIRQGDVVWFPAGEKHWHGAAPDVDFFPTSTRHVEQLLQESRAKELYTELPIIHLLPIANRKPPKDGFDFKASLSAMHRGEAPSAAARDSYTMYWADNPHPWRHQCRDGMPPVEDADVIARAEAVLAHELPELRLEPPVVAVPRALLLLLQRPDVRVQRVEDGALGSDAAACAACATESSRASSAWRTPCAGSSRRGSSAPPTSRT